MPAPGSRARRGPAPPDETLVDEIVAFSRSAGLRMRRRLAESGVPMGSSLCLWTLAKTGEIPSSHLAAKVGVRGPTLTGLVDTLERSRLIRRRASTEDRRVTLLSVTPRGQRLLERLHRELRDDWTEALASVPASRKRAWIVALREIRALVPAAPASEASP